MEMKVVVFDVEHGASAFIRTPTNHIVLIDCGATGSFSPALYLVENELPTAKQWNGRALTEMIVTHPHDDHIGDVETVKEKCPPALLLRQKYDWEDVKTAECDYDNLDTYSEWQNTYNATPPVLPDFGLKLASFMLSPEEAKAIDESKYLNNSSIVTIVTVTGTLHQEKFLFGGDMESAGWEALLKQPRFREAVKGVDFDMVSHHGHESGFSEALYAAMGKPILNIVSIHNNDEHIDDRYSQEAYAKGTQIVAGGPTRRSLTTRKDGTITINVTDEGKFWLSTQCLVDNNPAKVANDLSWMFQK
jgi:competence protein ComEC